MKCDWLALNFNKVFWLSLLSSPLNFHSTVLLLPHEGKGVDINLKHVTPPVTFLRFASAAFKLFHCCNLLCCFNIFHQQEMSTAINILELLEKKFNKCRKIVVKKIDLMACVCWRRDDNLTASFCSYKPDLLLEETFTVFPSLRAGTWQTLWDVRNLISNKNFLQESAQIP